jgi:hypothetical protein
MSMHHGLTTDRTLDARMSAPAYRRAMNLLWLDILVTLAILGAIASRF